MNYLLSYFCGMRNDWEAKGGSDCIARLLALLLLRVRFHWKSPKMRDSRDRLLAALSLEIETRVVFHERNSFPGRRGDWFSLEIATYLPFEGYGAISNWRLTLNNVYAQFDYATISDVVLHVHYTARDGGSAFA
jgi:hypothetical protein